jgi:hypothetical protein
MKLAYQPSRAKLMNLLSAGAFLFALILNALANLIPINGLQTGQISDMYANYFAPAGITFSIWGVIYTSLAVYVVWRLRYFKQHDDTPENRHLYLIDGLFALTSVANGAWIIAWHYLQFSLSLFFMMMILIGLILIQFAFKGDRGIQTTPFRIYFGWITIATVANVTTMIVANANQFRWLWNGGEVSQQLITTIILLIAILIGNLVILKFQDGVYGAVIVWSLLGIYLRHTTSLPNFGISGVANTALLGMIVTLVVIMWIYRKYLYKLIPKS